MRDTPLGYHVVTRLNTTPFERLACQLVYEGGNTDVHITVQNASSSDTHLFCYNFPYGYG